MCLKEGLNEEELAKCKVKTVGERKLLKRKISKLAGNTNKTFRSVTVFTAIITQQIDYILPWSVHCMFTGTIYTSDIETENKKWPNTGLVP